MTKTESAWEREYYSKGFAVCEHSIIDDTTFCRFRSETFEFDNGGDIDRILMGRGPREDYSRSMLYAEVAKLRRLKHNRIKKASNG